jgi:hypothetical protein
VGGKDTIARIIRKHAKHAKHAHQNVHKPNDQIETRKIIILPTLKLKGCAHRNEDEEDPNGRSEGVQS